MYAGREITEHMQMDLRLTHSRHSQRVTKTFFYTKWIAFVHLTQSVDEIHSSSFFFPLCTLIDLLLFTIRNHLGSHETTILLSTDVSLLEGI